MLFACLVNFDWMMGVANFTLLDAGFCFSALKSVGLLSVTQLSYQKSVGSLKGLFLKFVKVSPEQPLLCG